MYAFPGVFNQITILIAYLFLQIMAYPTNSVKWNPTIKQKITFLIFIFCRLTKKVNFNKNSKFVYQIFVGT